MFIIAYYIYFCPVLADVEKISDETGIPPYQLIPLMILRECVILNTQLSQIYEHLNMLYERKRKPKK
jgi:hypothetical protein